MNKKQYIINFNFEKCKQAYIDEIFLSLLKAKKISEKNIRLLSSEFSLDDWKHICQNQKLSEDFIREFKDKVCWHYISGYRGLSEDFIREFQDKVDWWCISEYQKLSENFIREFKDKVAWVYISYRQDLSDEFILEFKNEIDLNSLPIKKISEDTLSKLLRFRRNCVGYYLAEKIVKTKPDLSEEFIREFHPQLFCWDQISRYQDLSNKSNDFIKEFEKKLDWNIISRHQKLSKDFISSNLSKLNIKLLLKNKYISKDLKETIALLNN